MTVKECLETEMQKYKNVYSVIIVQHPFCSSNDVLEMGTVDSLLLDSKWLNLLVYKTDYFENIGAVVISIETDMVIDAEKKTTEASINKPHPNLTCEGCGYFDEDTKACNRSSEKPNLPTVKDFLDMYDDWNHLTKISSHSLEPLQEAKTDVIAESSPWLDNKVIAFGVYPYSEEDSTPLLCLRINHCPCDNLDLND